MDAAGAVLSASRVQAIRRRMLRWGRKHFAEFPGRHKKNIDLTSDRGPAPTHQGEQVVPVYKRFRTDTQQLKSWPDPRGKSCSRLSARWGSIGGRPNAQDGGTGSRSRSAAGEPGRPRALPGLARTPLVHISLHRGKRAVIIDANVVRWLGRVLGRRRCRNPSEGLGAGGDGGPDPRGHSGRSITPCWTSRCSSAAPRGHAARVPSGPQPLRHGRRDLRKRAR